MPFKTPPQISEAAVVSGAAKAVQRWDKVLVGGFLAGAYIAFGGLLAISVSSGLNPKNVLGKRRRASVTGVTDVVSVGECGLLPRPATRRI